LDAVLAEVESICSQIEHGKPIKLVPDKKVMFSDVNGIAFDALALDDATTLRDEVNLIISEMHTDGTLSKISMEWYGWDRTQPGRFPPTCG
jgi:ABC-type amino acid transport substrate-binding protein